MTDELYIPSGHEKGEELTRIQRYTYSFFRALIELFCRLYFRLEVKGRENIPSSGAFIVSPIHRSYLDTPVLGAMTNKRMRYMGKESLWTNKPLGWFLTTVGGFPVQRGTADREALNAALTVVQRGEPLVMFPEGTRQSGPVICDVFDGPAYVSCRTGAPILPVGLGGTESAMPKGKKFIRPVKMVIIVGEPIYPPPKSESGRVSRRAVRELTEQLSAAIQDRFDEAQLRVGKPNQH